MPSQIATGKQNFSAIIQNNYFYVDKTKFIKNWWIGGDDVTLITRPRRFGKTLMLDTVNTFFSPKFADRSDLFEGLEIWKDEQFRKLQGKIPVIFLSFANVKESTFLGAIRSIKFTIERCYAQFRYILNQNNLLSDDEHRYFLATNRDMVDSDAKNAILSLSEYLYRFYNAKPIILLDEYDTPLQDAWAYEYWDELADFFRGFFNSTFKTNQYLERGLISGITRIAKESIFSDLNNLTVVTVTSDLYSDCFGFTEEEVFNAMDTYGLTNKKEVKQWYDGFIFGDQKEIYNPWSIINFLSLKKLDTYWANTSSNALVGKLIAKSNRIIKEEIEKLLLSEPIITKLDEQIVFSELYTKNEAIWGLLLSAGYVKTLSFDISTRQYKLIPTNIESYYILENQISSWFNKVSIKKNDFINALLNDNIDDMNELMLDITENIFSYFDLKSGNKKEKDTAENFYHAFVLGLLVDLKGKYKIRSNRESGLGRYDICMFPSDVSNHGIIIEFKVMREKKERDLDETCVNALKQIKDKHYINELLAHKVDVNNIYIYGFAFKGKNVLISGGLYSEINL